MKPVALTVFSSLFLAAAAVAAAPQQDFEVRFALQAGEQAVDCQSPALPLGRTQVPSRLKDARFYVHDVRWIAADGKAFPAQLAQNEWQYLNLALLDLEDAQGLCAGNKGRHASITGKRPPGVYQALEFTVGVPVMAGEGARSVALNHSNTEQIAAPLDIQAMAWNWQAGRKFMKIEVAPEGGIQRANDTIKVWPVHLGSTGCVGNPANGESVECTSPNRFSVRLDGFDAGRDKVVLDIGALFAASDLGRDEGGAAGCMSSPQDPECAAIFEQLGLRLLPSGAGATDAGRALPGSGSRIFRAERQ